MISIIYLLVLITCFVTQPNEGAKHCSLSDLSNSQVICGPFETCEQYNSTSGICKCVINYEWSPHTNECIVKKEPTPSNNAAAITSDPTEKSEQESSSLTKIIFPVVGIAILVLGLTALIIVGKQRMWDRSLGLPHLRFGRRSSETRCGNLSQLECSDDDVPPYYASNLGGGDSHPYRGASLSVSDVPYSRGGFGGNDIQIGSNRTRHSQLSDDDDDDPPVC